MALWYLVVMFYYRFFIKTLSRIPYILPVSVLVSLAAGCICVFGSTAALGRAFGFLPFFIISIRSQIKHIGSHLNFESSVKILFVKAEILQNLCTVAPVLFDLYPRLQEHLAVKKVFNVLTCKCADFFEHCYRCASALLRPYRYPIHKAFHHGKAETGKVMTVVRIDGVKLIVK